MYTYTRQCSRREKKTQWGKRTSHKYIYTKGGEILGCYGFSATSPSTGASSSAAVDLVTRVPLVPLLPGGAAAASCPSRTPHRSDCSTARPTAPAPAHPIQQRLSSTSSVLSPSFQASAASCPPLFPCIFGNLNIFSSAATEIHILSLLLSFAALAIFTAIVTVRVWIRTTLLSFSSLALLIMCQLSHPVHAAAVLAPPPRV